MDIREIMEMADRDISNYLYKVIKNDSANMLRYAVKITENDFLLIMENILCSPYTHVIHVSYRLRKLVAICSSKIESISWVVSDKEIQVSVFYENWKTGLMEEKRRTLTITRR